MKSKKLITFLTMLFMVSVWSLGEASVQINQPAPDFTLTDSNGEKYSLSDYRGQYVVLEWVNYDCPFVKKHYSSGNMQGLQDYLGSQGVVWLSVNSSAQGKQGYFSPEEINTMMAEKEAHLTAYLIDSDGAIGKLYEAKTTPHMFVIDPQGVLIYKGAIDDKPSFDTADIPTSKNYVLSAYQEAAAGKAISVPITQPYGCSVKY